MSLNRLFSFALILLGGTQVLAQSVYGVPNLFNDNPSLTVPHAVLGRSCYSLRASALDLDCNSAFLANSDKRLLRANLVGTDSLRKVNDYRQMIGDRDEVGVADDLLAQNAPAVAKGAASIWYQDGWWAIGYVPVRAGVAYFTSNPSFPTVSVLGYRESELFGKMGLMSSADDKFQVGLQARYIKRDYIYQQFEAFSALDRQDLIVINQQGVLYVEPGFAYSWKTPWKPTLSWSLNNLAVAQSGDRVYSQPIYDAGLSSNIGGWEDLRSTLHFAVGPTYRGMFNRLTWSSVLDFDDVASTYLSFGVDQFGIGVQGRLAAFTAGIAYRNELISSNEWTSYSVSSVIFDLGLAF